MSDPEYVSNWELVAVCKISPRNYVTKRLRLRNTRRGVANIAHEEMAKGGIPIFHDGTRVFTDQIESLQLIDLEKKDNGE